MGIVRSLLLIPTWIALLAVGCADDEDDRERNLFVIGHLATNPLLEELNGLLPVYFEDGGDRVEGNPTPGTHNV